MKRDSLLTLQVKLCSYLTGEDSGFATPSKQEIRKDMGRMKNEMLNVFTYSQGLSIYC